MKRPAAAADIRYSDILVNKTSVGKGIEFAIPACKALDRQKTRMFVISQYFKNQTR